ncbi:MAG: hypothetical protein AAF708_02470 [Deinococcota bacterium]
MAAEYRYSMTRVCLSSERLTLPKRLAELFPSKGDITAVDAKTGDTFTLVVRPPRYLEGLGRFFRRHELDVNDEIIIDPLEDGSFAFSVRARPRKTEGDDAEIDAQQLCDHIVGLATPLSEAEIHALLPELPSSLNVADALARDPRLEKVEGRWQLRATPEVAPLDAPMGHSAAGEATTSDEAALSPEPYLSPEGDSLAAPESSSEQETSASAVDVSSAETNTPSTDLPSGTDLPTDSPTDLPDVIALEGNPNFDPDASDQVLQHVKAVPTQDSDLPKHVGLNSRDTRDVSSYSRARSYLSELGFRIELLSRDQFIANADLGRHHYSVLVHPLSEGGRLDWGLLLTQRREVASTYLAVFGHQQDLIRLTSPAAAARATCWSWQALESALELSQSVPVSPLDLESHFAKDGLLEESLTRFKASLNQRISERGVFSGVLRSLAAMKAPSVFMLSEVLESASFNYDTEGSQDLIKEQVLSVLEHLSYAPFHLVSRVDHGEFCLRYSVSDGLLHLSEYALSLRSHLPSRRTERLSGLPDPSDDEPEQAERITDTVQAVQP